eukprot:m.232823 g.232823  ORF g.232823 m.232823 type:complete len:79 (-) comp18867_c0_seq1:353-589(-)
MLARLVGVSFVLGAAIEFFMINVRIGSETFYDTAIRLKAQRDFEERQEKEKALLQQPPTPAQTPAPAPAASSSPSQSK